jgi:hypothetical protein
VAVLTADTWVFLGAIGVAIIGLYATRAAATARSRGLGRLAFLITLAVVTAVVVGFPFLDSGFRARVAAEPRTAIFLIFPGMIPVSLVAVYLIQRRTHDRM